MELLIQIVPLLLIVAVMYFLLLRPQKKREKEIQEMINEGETIEVKCQFCNTAYHYTVEDLKRIIKRSK